MTLIVGWVHPDEGAMFVTDERIVDLDGRPLGRGTKVLPVPHLAAVIVTNGSTWLGEAVGRLAVTTATGDVSGFVERTPAVLKAAWDAIPDTLQVDAQYERSRVFVVGQSDARFCWWQFTPPRFAARRLHHRRYCTPMPGDWPKGVLVEEFETLAEMVDLAVRIKVERDDAETQRRLDGRVHGSIGGALWATTLGPGPTFLVQRVVTFDE